MQALDKLRVEAIILDQPLGLKVWRKRYGHLTYRVAISVTISNSNSALLIFSSEDNCGRPPKRNDIFEKIDHVSGSRGLGEAAVYSAVRWNVDKINLVYTRIRSRL